MSFYTLFIFLTTYKMRKITADSVRAFERGEKFSGSNTRVKSFDNFDGELTTQLFLHDNFIAEKNHATGKVKITNAGWQSNTTKERLNGISGVSICQKNFQWFLNGKEWDGELTTV